MKKCSLWGHKTSALNLKGIGLWQKGVREKLEYQGEFYFCGRCTEILFKADGLPGLHIVEILPYHQAAQDVVAFPPVVASRPKRLLPAPILGHYLLWLSHMVELCKAALGAACRRGPTRDAHRPIRVAYFNDESAGKGRSPAKEGTVLNA